MTNGGFIIPGAPADDTDGSSQLALNYEESATDPSEFDSSSISDESLKRAKAIGSRLWRHSGVFRKVA